MRDLLIQEDLIEAQITEDEAATKSGAVSVEGVADTVAHDEVFGDASKNIDSVVLAEDGAAVDADAESLTCEPVDHASASVNEGACERVGESADENDDENTHTDKETASSGASNLKSNHAASQKPVSLEQLIDHASVWRGVQSKGVKGGNYANTLSTGYPVLDQCLPGGGWPRASLTEILVPQPGSGELQLVLPALTTLSQSHEDEARRWVSWIAPPYVPYAPALATAGIDLSRMLLVHAKAGLDIMWSAEQALRSGTCAAVLVWAPKVTGHTLRRLQLAAEEGDSWGIVFRSLSAGREPSPAAVRLQLAFDERGKTLHLLKSRGGRPLRMAADFLTP